MLRALRSAAHAVLGLLGASAWHAAHPIPGALQSDKGGGMRSDKGGGNGKEQSGDAW